VYYKQSSHSSLQTISLKEHGGAVIGLQLESSQVGIIIVTRDSLFSPWIMFEAGALSKNLGRARVVPILVDLEPLEVRGPLEQFQCATFDVSEIRRVLRMLNSELKDVALTEDVLEAAFVMWWPTLDREVAELLRKSKLTRTAATRSDRELLEEILGLSRSVARHQSQSPAPHPLEMMWPSTLDKTPPKLSGALTRASVEARLRSGGNLAGANLMGLNLAGLDMSGANLRGSNLVSVNLSDANLENADLDGANLEGAILERAELSGAQISRTNLWRASMRDVRNLALVKSMDEANFFEVTLNDPDKDTVSENRTISVDNYPELFDYFRDKGMTRDEIANVFLWAAHSYPGEAP
jgi:Pentapeptide repeats (8 copies)